MKKIKLVGKNLADIRPLLGRYGMEESESDFELIVCHGGDGALLGAAREFPGIPKFPLRDAATAPTCPEHLLFSQLERFRNGELKTTRLPFLSGVFEGKTVRGINDIFLRNALVSSALRYRVEIDGSRFADEMIGDGIGFSSVHGSTAYFRCITQGVFRTGVGLAFSNTASEINHVILDCASHVVITVLRGPAVLFADNGATLEIPDGGKVEMFQTKEFTEVIGLEDFMCPVCRKLRHKC